ncbi:hypothetical protein PR202_gb07901 [Eleusine coracana subsp. coracana]|uniref:CCHC-type domain-containing protein n=1 Tax=Eleusine coracana subsp. coracana TaxID=191504 RepID=A0AAV5EDB3_ELECO|nr:hypothetical protein PR202_gb07901 [Eleusine coracana subsp. coracana]
MDLKQGGRNVLQYSEAFNHLAQYATEYVNTEEKRRYTFLHGMNATLKERLTWQTTDTYNDLVNAAIVQEGATRQVEEEDRKRKAPATASAAPQVKHHLIYTSPTGQRFRAASQQQLQRRFGPNYSRQSQQQNFPPRAPYQQQNNQYRAPYQQQGNPSARAPLPADRGGNYPCYNCGRTDHFAKNCTAPRRNNSYNNQRQNQSRNVNAPSCGAQVNYTNAEDIPQGEPVLTDTLSLYRQPVLALFDSGATSPPSTGTLSSSLFPAKRTEPVPCFSCHGHRHAELYLGNFSLPPFFANQHARTPPHSPLIPYLPCAVLLPDFAKLESPPPESDPPRRREPTSGLPLDEFLDADRPRTSTKLVD